MLDTHFETYRIYTFLASNHIDARLWGSQSPRSLSGIHFPRGFKSNDKVSMEKSRPMDGFRGEQSWWRVAGRSARKALVEGARMHTRTVGTD